MKLSAWFVKNNSSLVLSFELMKEILKRNEQVKNPLIYKKENLLSADQKNLNGWHIKKLEISKN